MMGNLHCHPSPRLNKPPRLTFWARLFRLLRGIFPLVAFAWAVTVQAQAPTNSRPLNTLPLSTINSATKFVSIQTNGATFTTVLIPSTEFARPAATDFNVTNSTLYSRGRAGKLRRGD